MKPPVQRFRNKTCLIKRLCQVLGALLMCNIPIGRMADEEFLLAFQRGGHRFLRIDILLTPIHDAGEPKFEGVCPSGQDIVSICPRVHEVKLGKDSDGPTTLWVDGSSKFQRLRVGKVDICGGN